MVCHVPTSNDNISEIFLGIMSRVWGYKLGGHLYFWEKEIRLKCVCGEWVVSRIARKVEFSRVNNLIIVELSCTISRLLEV